MIDGLMLCNAAPLSEKLLVAVQTDQDRPTGTGVLTMLRVLEVAEQRLSYRAA